MSTNSTDDSSAILRAAGSFGLVLAALAVATAAGVALLLAETAFDLGTNAVTVANFVLSQGAFLVVAIPFLALVTGWSLVSARVPDRSDLLVLVVGLAVAVAVEVARQVAIQLTSLSQAGTVSLEEGLATWAIAVALVVVVVVAPVVEELFFRGIVQGWIADASSARAGIAVATLLFVPIHGMQIALFSPDVVSAVSVVLVLVVVSVVLGVAYARTGNIVVPMLLHGAYNASSAVVPTAVQELLAVGWLPVL